MFFQKLGNWIKQEWSSVAIGVVGIVFILAAKLSEPYLSPRFPHAAEPLGYLMEHLGAVLVVAILVRVALEEGYQKAFLGSVNKEVASSIDRTSQTALVPLSTELAKATSSISILDERLSASVDQVSQLSAALTYKIIQNLDPQLRKVLEERVLNAPFKRPTCALHVELRPYSRDNDPHAQELLEMFIDIDYSILNQSESDAAYNCVFWLDDVIRPSGEIECYYTHFSFGPIDQGGKAHLNPSADLKLLREAGHITLEKTLLRLEYEITDIAPGRAYAIKIAGRNLVRSNDLLIWSMVNLTNKLSFTIDLGGGLTLSELEVSPRALHHAEGTTTINGDTQIKFELDHILLPYQGVEVRWARRPQQGR